MSPDDFLNRIREGWLPLAEAGRIIPFCTPIVRRPPAIVVGTNHSWFDPDPTVAERIATDFSERIPSCNTFTEHNHKFAVQLRKVAKQAGIHVTSDWVGTNRCAVQTGPTGIAALHKLPGYAACQRRTDELLVEFIQGLEPRNVLLFGRHAQQLFYKSSRRFSDTTARELDNSARTKLIPLPHLSHRGALDAIVVHFGSTS